MIYNKVNGFEIKSDKLFLQIGIVSTIMECVGIYFFIPMFFEPISSSMDIFGIAFLSLWLLVVLSGAVISFYRYSKRIVVDDNGVVYKSILKKRHYKWEEIKDFGLVYDGRTRYGRNIYIVYFADDRQKDKNEYRKILSKNVLKAHILSDDYLHLTKAVIPFCCERTEINPFVPKDSFHWL